jgi:hypothetical protein
VVEVVHHIIDTTVNSIFKKLLQDAIDKYITT